MSRNMCKLCHKVCNSQNVTHFVFRSFILENCFLNLLSLLVYSAALHYYLLFTVVRYIYFFRFSVAFFGKDSAGDGLGFWMERIYQGDSISLNRQPQWSSILQEFIIFPGILADFPWYIACNRPMVISQGRMQIFLYSQTLLCPI